jgi:hypothetical protein
MARLILGATGSVAAEVTEIAEAVRGWSAEAG